MQAKVVVLGLAALAAVVAAGAVGYAYLGGGAGAGGAGRDCADCPEMAAIPAGQVATADGRIVVVQQPFSIGRYEVTRTQWLAYTVAVEKGTWSRMGCRVHEPGYAARDNIGRSQKGPGFDQTDRDPAVCVSHEEATAYVKWLSQKTGRRYALPSEAQWEYAARAGMQTNAPWPDDGLACDYANVADLANAENFDKVERTAASAPTRSRFACRDGRAHTTAGGAYLANAFGLRDMLGNAAEWTDGCWTERPGAAEDCGRRVVRGGSWIDGPDVVGFSSRVPVEHRQRDSAIGFRIVRLD
jgi:sulfatase modifying factor 1